MSQTSQLIEEYSTSENTPKALWKWDLDARVGLPAPLKAWLALLVLTCLASIVFLANHAAPRWVLGGFILSHVIVFCLPLLHLFQMRRGFVSLTHVVCWTPGLIAVIASHPGGVSQSYQAWSLMALIFLSISLVFDLRDSIIYLSYVITGRIHSVE